MLSMTAGSLTIRKVSREHFGTFSSKILLKSKVVDVRTYKLLRVSGKRTLTARRSLQSDSHVFKRVLLVALKLANDHILLIESFYCHSFFFKVGNVG